MISADKLRETLKYEPETGLFTWLISKQGVRAGMAAGSSRPDGYSYIHIDHERYYSHRLAYLYMTGGWPEDEVDHINGYPSDNRWSNLRAATRQQNMMNRKPRESCPLKGAYRCPTTGRWKSQIVVSGQTIHLGRFDTAEQAHEAYRAGSIKYHGEFGRPV